MTEPIVARAAGPAAHRPRIEMGTFGPWQANAYLVWDGSSDRALIVDPGMGASPQLMDRVAANELTLEVIGNSHGHIDHIFDNAPLKRASGAQIAIHAEDAYRLSGENVYGFEVEPSQADRHLHEGEQLHIGQLIFDVLHTPGHTEGSICLYEERHGLLLSGDVLFRGSYGRTDFRGGDDQAMVASLRRIATQLPPATRVLPGHGPETTVERELPWMRRIADSGRLLMPG
jgi:hydroxyacylglutathione hydrolase